MTAYHVDDEELEAAKLWWRRYGRWLTLIVLLGLLGFFSWKGWEYHLGKQDFTASALYSTMLANAQNNNDPQAWEQQANALITHYPSTPYATLSAFMLAKTEVMGGHLGKAATHLRWVMNHGIPKNLREIAALRLARVLIAQNKPDEALKLLASGFGEAYLPLTQEISGDAWMAKGKLQKARDAYEEALAGAQSMGLPTKTLKMKINALPAPKAQGDK